MKKITKYFWLVLVALSCSVASTARADEVTDWNQIMFRAANVPPVTSPLIMSRVAAIVHAAIFDAVNGIERRYTPYHVEPNAQKKSSARAAAIQAAYATLVKLYPNQKNALDEDRAASLAALASGGPENKKAIERGIEWGQTVADAILSLRSTDGLTPAPPPFMGGPDIGQWRPTIPALAPGASPQFATMTPWAIQSPSQFRPEGPPELTSDRYAKDFNEAKTLGSAASSSRTPDQTVAALFWASTNTNYFWNNAAVILVADGQNTLSENARLFALMNIAIADAAIACWDAKYHYVFWRPLTAIQFAVNDGNALTGPDSCWAPLRATPAHPEYPSGHSSFSGAAARVLATFFGEDTSFIITSDGMPGVVRTFRSFSAALDEVTIARICAGFHFRSACEDAQSMGKLVADYVIANSLRPAK
jgi:hypothetical protein